MQRLFPAETGWLGALCFLLCAVTQPSEARYPVISPSLIRCSSLHSNAKETVWSGQRTRITMVNAPAPDARLGDSVLDISRTV